ncbi:MAG: fatty acid desaturase [Chitinophagaceae bacterium]|nr:fatty acid desaturase [Chitinophagaceae bacterium]
MQTLQPITDPTFQETANSRTDQFLLGFISDKRDLPFVKLTIKISVTLIPIGILLFIPAITGPLWWALAITYFFLNNIIFKGPFGLMLHCTSHRKFFIKKFSFLNHYLPWVVGPFFGQTPETYYSHHIWMHHPENNLEEDRSTTMPYQRDSFFDFLRYFFDFLFVGLIRLVNYFRKKNHPELIVKCLMGEFSFLFLCIGLSFISFPATLAVFIIPFFLSRFIMMLGNWTQHAFIDAKDPSNPYMNSVTCVNTKYNKKCWNDGYHASHHVRQGMHYTEHPEYFLKTINKYTENKAVVFQGIGFLSIFWYLMRGDYHSLAKNAVNINNTFSGDSEFIEHLKSRCNRIPRH